MFTNWVRKIAKTKQFYDGAKILPEHTRNLAFKNNADNLTHMFELRAWYIKNSPHSHYSEKYSNQMTYLHNELNYLHSVQMLKRVLLVGGLIFGYATFILEQSSHDFKDQFDLKFNTKAYGSAADSSGEGASAIDD